MAHLTCQGHSRGDIADILIDYRAEGVENILALGGDPPTDADGPMASDYRHASELVDDVAEHGGFSIGVAAHPELHPRSPDRHTDRRHLADKLRRADFAITQFFFELDHYLAMVDDLAALGVDKPVLPGHHAGHQPGQHHAHGPHVGRRGAVVVDRAGRQGA